MTPDQVIKHFTRGLNCESRNQEIVAVAEALNVNRQTVWVWVRDDRVPRLAQQMIASMTHGKLRAD